MAKLLFSFMFISCLILVSGNVIPNHINTLGSSNAINSNVANNAVADIKANPFELCLKSCKDSSDKLCKFNCENRHVKRAEPEQYNDCLKKCFSSAMVEPQAPTSCECRSSCDKLYPKNKFVW